MTVRYTPKTYMTNLFDKSILVFSFCGCLGLIFLLVDLRDFFQIKGRRDEIKL